MEYRGSLPAEELRAKMREYDVLVHAEAFDAKSAHATRLSVSTKIPEYLASGVPVLAVGPEQAASIRYIRDARAGAVVTRRNAGAMSGTLSLLMADEELRKGCAQRALALARTCHEAAANRERFRLILFACAGIKP